MRLSVRYRLQNALFGEVPAAECAFPHLGKRRLTSRKTAFCPDGLTQKRILDSTPHAKAHSGGSEDPRAHLSMRTSYRMRFSVTCRLQNALFRRVRFFSPGQMRRRLTKRRTLSRRSHAKAHSATRLMDEASTPRSQAIQAAFHATGSRDSFPLAPPLPFEEDCLSLSCT